MHASSFKKFITLFFAVMVGIFTGTCTYSWRATPDPDYSFPRCETLGSFPQMIQIPTLENTWQTQHDCDLHPPEKVAVAILVFYNNWRLKFGGNSKIQQSLNNLLVEWSADKKNVTGYSVDGIKFINSPVVGLARTPTWIWVRTEPGDKICQTAFIHELVHIAIWALKGSDGDTDHEGTKYSGWTMSHSILIRETNAALCGLGI